MSDSDSSEYGWLYCFENPSMPGIYNIGGSTDTPEDVLMDANKGGEWVAPTPYQLVLVRHVGRVREIERVLHSLLEELGLRVHPQKAFFRVSLSVVEKCFKLAETSEPDDE
jgi:hypothetical protein